MTTAIHVTSAERHPPAVKFLVLNLLVLSAAAGRPCVLKGADPKPLPELTETRVISSLDGTPQNIRFWAPADASTKPAPILVFLHSWSGDYRQKNDDWQRQAVQREWIYLHPDFRGRNDHPAACGSRLARQDILDALAFIRSEFKVDENRIYLAGTSGGGHMSMLMAGHHPDRFSAVSAWVGISDLAEWYRFHLKDGQPQNYARMILKSLGGPPGSDPARDAEYRDRSPLYHLHAVGDLPVELAAGIRDGHSGSVPVRHTLLAWNRIARAQKEPPVPAADISDLTSLGGQPDQLSERLEQLQVSPEFGRRILLRRTAGPSRVTIFDGGHEGLATAACDWLAVQRRPVR